MQFEHQSYSTTGYLGFVMRKWFAFSALMVLGQLSTVSWWLIVARLLKVISACWCMQRLNFPSGDFMWGEEGEVVMQAKCSLAL